jgi:hypothetical protein
MVISQTCIDKMIETAKREKKISCRDLEELIRAELLSSKVDELVFTQAARAILKKGSNNFIKAIQGATSRK